MLATGKYEVISLAGAQKHADMRPVVTQEWGQSWRIYPVKDYGTKELVREFLNKEKPDIMWVMTDQDFGFGCGRWKTRFVLMFQSFIIMCGIIFQHHSSTESTTCQTTTSSQCLKCQGYCQ